MKCSRCNVDMVSGMALENTPAFGVEDFPGQTALRGQTFSMTGPARMVAVMKCPNCGHSFEPSTNGRDGK